MAKKILGIDIGYNQMKLAFCQGNRVLKTVTVPMPENLLREGKVTSPEAMAERTGAGSVCSRAGTCSFKDARTSLPSVSQLRSSRSISPSRTIKSNAIRCGCAVRAIAGRQSVIAATASGVSAAVWNARTSFSSLTVMSSVR